MRSISLTLPRNLLQQTFKAFQYRNYRLWFFGQLVSLFGTWMQNTAQGFLVYELTGSPAYLGVVGFAAGVPAWLFMLYGGVIADRYPRRTIMVVTQTMMMSLAFILATLTYFGVVQPWHIVILAFLLGTANAFDTPARMALVSDLVQHDDLTNAIALNSGMFNAATIVGPAVAGITYAAFGPAWCFLLNGISFLALIAALILMRLPPVEVAPQRRSLISGLKEALQYIQTETIVRTIILVVAVVSLFGASFQTLFPAWAVDVLGGDVTTNGLLRSAQGVGAVISALMIASLSSSGKRGKILTVGLFLFPLLLIVFAQIHQTTPALLVLVLIGISVVMIFNLANSMVQINVPDALRGRVMSVYSLTFFGTFPIGSLIMGTLAEYVNEMAAVLIGATVLLTCAVLVTLTVPRLRAV